MTTKTLSLTLLLAFSGLLSCKTNSLKNATVPETGMFKVTILYPNGENKTFDMDYYENKHMPMVAGYLGENLKFYEIDKGLSGRTPEDKIPFVAIGYFYVRNIEAYNKSIAQNREAIIGDIKHYTNIQPIVQISEIKKLAYNKTQK